MQRIKGVHLAGLLLKASSSRPASSDNAAAIRPFLHRICNTEIHSLNAELTSFELAAGQYEVLRSCEHAVVLSTETVNKQGRHKASASGVKL